MQLGPRISMSPAQSAAANVCTSFHRAYRDLRFYPAQHPMARQTMELLVSTLEDFLAKYEGLSLEVSEVALSFDRVEVYTHDSDRDNLAFIMFRDGVRTLEFFPGIREDEVEAFVECLAHADDLALMEHDLVTTFWDQDFTHIDYKVADPFLEGEVLREGMVDALRETVLQRLDAIVAAIGVAGEWTDQLELEPVAHDQVDLSEIGLTASDQERSEREVEKLDGILQDFGEVLAELAIDDIERGVGCGPKGADGEGGVLGRPMLESMTGAVKAFLDEGDHEGASLLLERVKGSAAGDPRLMDELREVFSAAVTVDHVSGLLERRSDAASEGSAIEGVDGSDGGGLLMEIRPWILGQLLHALVEVQDRTVRKEILGHLDDGEGVPWSHLEPLLKDRRWYVVRNAIQLAAARPHLQLTEHAQRLLGDPDVRVRREILRALEKIGGESTIRGAVKAMDDEDSTVRISAARSIGRWGGAEEEALLLARIQDRGFSALPPKEVEALLAAYAILGQERAIPLFDKLRRRKLFSSRPVAFRAAVIAALGYVGLPSARSILMEASKSREGPIRRAAVLALQMQAASIGGKRS